MSKIQERLAELKKQQENGTYTLCPRCGNRMLKPELYTNATSRLADIMICDLCGQEEAVLAFMRNPGTVYSWDALQPRRPASDFKALTGAEAWERIKAEQAGMIFGLQKMFEDGKADLEIRFEAFESLPGLTQIWTSPFYLRYGVADGTVSVRVVRTGSGMELAAELIEK